ncbi:hypothetical protein NC652_038014, partial [Populus alba x Populus x berolinensis]
PFCSKSSHLYVQKSLHYSMIFINLVKRPLRIMISATSQVVELLHSLGKSERGLAITCLKSVLCRTGKRVCLVCKDFLIQNMDNATPYTEPLSVRKLIVLVSLFFIVIY